MIDDAPVDLLRHPLVEAAIPRLHVKDGNLAALGRYHRETAVCIPEHEEGVRLFLSQHRINRRYQPTDRLRRSLGTAAQEMCGPRDTEVIKEDLVELVIVVLPGMDQHMIAVLLASARSRETIG